MLLVCNLMLGLTLRQARLQQYVHAYIRSLQTGDSIKSGVQKAGFKAQQLGGGFSVSIYLVFSALFSLFAAAAAPGSARSVPGVPPLTIPAFRQDEGPFFFARSVNKMYLWTYIAVSY